MEIRLIPGGRLALDCAENDVFAELRHFSDSFSQDWRQGLFLLGSKGNTVPSSATMRFWGGLAARLLTRICHVASDVPKIVIDDLDIEETNLLIEQAPPMVGGEYLSHEVLSDIWRSLSGWVLEKIQSDGGVEAFLEKRAPGWNKVGRVTFHLAENKSDPARPFAFMSTFTTGMGAGGQLCHLPLNKALEIYAGADDKQALIKLLSPVNEASKKCEWVKTLMDSGDIFRPMAWTASRAYQMLRSSIDLEESGLILRLPNWWKKKPRPRVCAVIDKPFQSLLSAESLLNFNIEIALGDERITRKELDELLAEGEGLVSFKGQWVEVDRKKLEQALNHLEELERHAEDGRISFVEGMRLLAGVSSDRKRDEFFDQCESWAEFTAGPALSEAISRLRNPANLAIRKSYGELNGILRPYQKTGVEWLSFLYEMGLGACLADDMGLGKTIQVLTLIGRISENRRMPPSILVIPASLLGNWRSEAEKFMPGLKLIFMHPSEISSKELDELAMKDSKKLSEADLLVTTYSMVVRNAWLAEKKWNLVILDEAQAIKNHTTAQSRAVKKLQGRSKIAMTGTPVENRLGDLWSLFDFLNPGLLGSSAQFKNFIKDREMHGENSFGPLKKLVSPYIMRRLKTDKNIISDLPEKTEATQYSFLTKEQIKCYQRVVDSMQDALAESGRPEGIARRGLILQIMMKLKQICNHPAQYAGDGEYDPARSGKFSRLREICLELAERQEKVVIFTQFREIIPALESCLAEVFGRPGLHLHGATNIRARKGIVDEFQNANGPPFFILSLKAGGTGLNLTAASHVIHFDRWWNPAVENQATDRCFRIGQKRNVLVHKFVTRGTIEEKIDQMISDKSELAEMILSKSGEVNITELSDEELLNLVRLDITRSSAS